MESLFSIQSSQLLLLMSENYCSSHEEDFKPETLTIFKEFYNNLNNAIDFMSKIDISNNRSYIKIRNFNDIPKPSDDYDYIIKNVRDTIKATSQIAIIYNFKLFKRNIHIYFISPNESINMQIFDEYTYKILVWLFIVTKYNTDKACSKTLNIYIYLTKLLKYLPSNEDKEISKNHVNTGFTTTCSKNSNIVIFRDEEWFKVFIHETFHNLGLDFSNLNNRYTKRLILKIFPVKSNVNLYEAYTDSWAKIINVIICSYFISNKTFNDYINNIKILINLEKTYSIFQMIKILKFMGLTYNDLYSLDPEDKSLRDMKYREKTNTLSYYILSSIIMNRYQDFFGLCADNNINILQFDKSVESQGNLCKFIEKHYKTESMLSIIKCITELLNMFKNKKQDTHVTYLLKNMRKSICELN